MTDDRLRRWLEVADRPAEPNPGFAATLLDDLRQELGFDAAPPVRTLDETGVRSRPASGRTGGRPVDLLILAAVLALAAGGLAAVTGALRDRLAIHQPADRLTAIRAARHIQIAIRPDYPQFTIGGQPAAGFDADVAAEIARRLHVSPELVIEDAATMLQQRSGGSWDIALPSVPAWVLDGTAFGISTPYYRWPHFLIVPISSTAGGVQDVARGPICAVAGDGGEAWLRGSYGGASALPLTTAVMTTPTDNDCLAALASGAAVAAITAHMSAADLQVRSDTRAIGGPAPEPRAVIVPLQFGTGPDSGTLGQAINDVLAAMGADGTLTRLSQSRFGGADLTAT